MRLIDADQMAVDEYEAYMSAQVQITDDLKWLVNFAAQCIFMLRTGTKVMKSMLMTIPAIQKMIIFVKKENERKYKHENYI